MARPATRRREQEFFSFLSKSVILLFFLLVNGISFTIKPEMATMFVVPSVCLLFQKRLVGVSVTVMAFVVASALITSFESDIVYVLDVHILFYSTVLLKNVAQRASLAYEAKKLKNRKEQEKNARQPRPI
ncbi:uncharacterized protein LOC101851614 [Aplysia californica]|uniref:Uncharacterized protein LOC101851614 n=1 Tax=Aplysia californica TaxID=6500 RepID=A0ABM0K7H5_APLCA|nr:uncharacterized protein LOC101851614 [Aplysia californica]